MASVQEFISEYARAISEGYAAVFAGAGLSRDSGYASWKDLVSPLATEIGLDINKEHDFVAVAQYYRNERGTRSAINQRILNEYTRGTTPNDNIKILTRMPISTYWTTNYDELLEEGLRENNRKADIKTTKESLATNIYDRDAIIYKMHGDVRDPSKAVLTKDDYVMYGQERPLFTTALRGDLVSKTFLFIGFSFEDPNVDFILSQIRILLGESQRDHYCFFEKVKRNDGESESDFQYRSVKQELRIKDLRRYGIQTVFLNTYAEISGILQQVERGINLRNIFISGSMEVASDPWTIDSSERFAFLLSQTLVQKGYRIISGFGLRIGSSVINGALEVIMHSKFKHINEHLSLHPFPQVITGTTSKEELTRIYRENMLQQAGVAIFIYGNKKVDGNLMAADGMLEEFEIASRDKKVIIPVGSTGDTAAIIHESVKTNIAKHPYLSPNIDKLGLSVDTAELIQMITKIIDDLQLF